MLPKFNPDQKESTSNIKSRLGPGFQSLQLPQVSVPPKSSRPLLQDRDIPLDVFLTQLQSDLLASHSLDRLYNRTFRDLAAMKRNPEFQNVVKSIVKGVLFDAECNLDSDSVHKILKLLDYFDLDNTSTWTFLIDRCFTLITENNKDHFKRLSTFNEMTFNHLLLKKTKLLPYTALCLFKMAEVSPFKPSVKPNIRASLKNLRSTLATGLTEEK